MDIYISSSANFVIFFLMSATRIWWIMHAVVLFEALKKIQFAYKHAEDELHTIVRKLWTILRPMRAKHVSFSFD